jgi:hypothetical protein
MLDNRYKQIGFKAISIPQVAMMANSNLQRTIKIVKPSKPNEITALVTFEKRDKVKYSGYTVLPFNVLPTL